MSVCYSWKVFNRSWSSELALRSCVEKLRGQSHRPVALTRQAVGENYRPQELKALVRMAGSYGSLRDWLVCRQVRHDPVKLFHENRQPFA